MGRSLRAAVTALHATVPEIPGVRLAFEQLEEKPRYQQHKREGADVPEEFDRKEAY